MIEILIVAALVLWSAVVVFKKVFPKTSSSVFTSVADACAARGWARLAAWLKPAAPAGCGGSCGCSASEEPAQNKAEVQAVKWK
ncbi:DUF6587 family protein [Acinetobacter sp. ANC 3813]|uniref:DUF6587 family protein n=1 Tax=Acinetobacter sp. ANC 3813 TaxID=1977873 RepID=UPI000A32B2B9|nr:DUF6587 family protein [Acinetobacter sp. ANC 3813]OTG86256.1 hypothetical protein B9T34_17855 [Acinetobacter sp. ANC 3813]